jgi:antitoxin HigA-1
MMSESLTITDLEVASKLVAGPFRCHPGEILKEEFLLPLGLSANKLAIALRVPSGRIVDIINEKRAISADTALRLAQYFNMSPGFWLNLQADFDLAVAQDEKGEAIAREITPMAAQQAA